MNSRHCKLQSLRALIPSPDSDSEQFDDGRHCCTLFHSLLLKTLSCEMSHIRTRLYVYNRAGFGCNWTYCFIVSEHKDLASLVSGNFWKTTQRVRRISERERYEQRADGRRFNRNPLPSNCATANVSHTTRVG